MGLTASLLRASPEPQIALCGELSATNAAQLAPEVSGCLPEPASGLSLELAELEIEDTAAATAMVDLVRELGARYRPLVLLHSPQLLAHTLYRIGMLQHSAVTLVAPREEEPYG